MTFDLLPLGLCCLLVFFAGFVDSIAGGGGLISLPTYFALGLPSHLALGTNKFSSFMGTLTSTFRYWRAGKIHARVGLLSAAGALLGSAVGARAALLVPARVINTVMLVMVPLVLLFLLLKNRILPGLTAQDADESRPVAHIGLKGLVVGVVIGVYDGFFGPGTGAFLTIGFHLGLRFDLLRASATARMTNLASNFGALAVFMANGQVIFPLAIYAAVAGIAGNQLGSRLALKKGERVIKPIMVFVLLLLMAEVVRQRFF